MDIGSRFVCPDSNSGKGKLQTGRALEQIATIIQGNAITYCINGETGKRLREVRLGNRDGHATPSNHLKVPSDGAWTM